MTTYTKNNLTITEFNNVARGSCEYVIASEACDVDPEQLRQLFDKSYLFETGLVNAKANNDIGKLSVGREGVTVFTYGVKQLVLRHYRRGGMMRHLVKERYLWQGLEKTRAFGEMDVLQRLSATEVDVCQPFAALLIRQGFFYQASLITHLVPEAIPLSSVLAERALPSSVWKRLAGAISSLHANGVFHADLNAHNILMVDNKPVFIDFDKALIKTEAGTWQQSNLDRLLRSLEKLKKLNGIHFEPQDWDILQQNYASLPPRV